MIILLFNGSKVKTFSADSIEEVKEHAKDIEQLEERLYKIGQDFYHVNWQNQIPVKLTKLAKSGMEFEEIILR